MLLLLAILKILQPGRLTVLLHVEKKIVLMTTTAVMMAMAGIDSWRLYWHGVEGVASNKRTTVAHLTEKKKISKPMTTI
jgi:hypothetical protein